MCNTLIITHCTPVKIRQKLAQLFILYLNVLQRTTKIIHISSKYSLFMPNLKMFRADCKWDLLPLRP